MVDSVLEGIGESEDQRTRGGAMESEVVKSISEFDSWLFEEVVKGLKARVTAGILQPWKQGSSQ